MTWSHKLCVAPMMDTTDKHCRFFHRLLAPKAFLYTEMINANAVVLGKRTDLLNFDSQETPVGLQLGGSDPHILAKAAKMGSKMGYSEVNLNCGCPSPKVNAGDFGACLMKSPLKVVECIKAMQDASEVTISVKHRIGIGPITDYEFVSDFVGTLQQAGCNLFIVHARNAILNLSPKKNREIPPLDLVMVRMLKKEFPDSNFIANGGLASVNDCMKLFKSISLDTTYPKVDGVMLGRSVIKKPLLLRDLSQSLENDDVKKVPTLEEIMINLNSYFIKRESEGVPAARITRQWHGLFSKLTGARKWRRLLSSGYKPLDAYNEAFR